MKTLTSLAIAGALLGASTAAQAVTLDFDSGVATYSGLNNLTGYSQDGLDFAVSLGSGDRRASGANLFNTLACSHQSNTTTNCNGNDDGDLVPQADGENGVAGNVLIRQENGNRGNQQGALDDDASGNGSITFTLLSGPSFSLLGFSAVDDGTFSISVDGNTLGTLRPGDDRATAITSFAASPILNIGDSFTVNYRGSGAVDSIGLAPVPLPAALPLLAAGLGGLAYMGRRRKKA